MRWEARARASPGPLPRFPPPPEAPWPPGERERGEKRPAGEKKSHRRHEQHGRSEAAKKQRDFKAEYQQRKKRRLEKEAGWPRMRPLGARGIVISGFPSAGRPGAVVVGWIVVSDWVGGRAPLVEQHTVRWSRCGNPRAMAPSGRMPALAAVVRLFRRPRRKHGGALRHLR